MKNPSSQVMPPQIASQAHVSKLNVSPSPHSRNSVHSQPTSGFKVCRVLIQTQLFLSRENANKHGLELKIKQSIIAKVLFRVHKNRDELFFPDHQMSGK